MENRPVKRLILLLSLLAALLLAACGTSQQPVSRSDSGQRSAPKATPAPPSKDTITAGSPSFGGTEPGASEFSYGDANAGVTLTNDSKTDAAESISMQWTAYNAAGQVINTEPTTIGIIMPKQTLYVTTDFINTALSDIARVTVIALPNRWLPAPADAGVITGQNISVVAAGTDEPGTYNVSGELASTWTDNLQSVPAWAYCTDAAGKFVGGGRTVVNLIPSKGTGVGSLSLQMSASATPSTCTIDAQPVLLPAG